MKRIVKRIVFVLVLLIVLSPLILYIGITIGNDCIADKVEKELASYPLPDGTVLVDSLSAAGKLTGNGNGMQYMGAILISGDVSVQDISEHYGKEFEYIEVQRQTTPAIDSVRSNSCEFQHFDNDSSDTYYSVICWGSKHDYVNEFFCGILDFDLRGH